MTHRYRIFEERDNRLFESQLDDHQLHFVASVRRAFQQADAFQGSDRVRGVFVSRKVYHNVMQISRGLITLAGKLPLQRYSTMVDEINAVPGARVRLTFYEVNKPSTLKTALSYVPLVSSRVSAEPTVSFIMEIPIPASTQYGPRQQGSMERNLQSMYGAWSQLVRQSPQSAYHTPRSATPKIRSATPKIRSATPKRKSLTPKRASGRKSLTPKQTSNRRSRRSLTPRKGSMAMGSRGRTRRSKRRTTYK